LPRSAGRYPDRFVGLGTVPFQAPDLAIDERRAIAQIAGFSRHRDHDPWRRRDLSAERFRKIFAPLCEELGLVVFMHPDGFTEPLASPTTTSPM